MIGAIETNAAATAVTVIERHPLGIVFRAPMPVTEFSAFAKHYGAQGFKLMVTELCAPLRAAAVLVRSESDAEAWKAQVNETALRRSGGDPELTWLNGTDTGTSSLAIFSVCSERGFMATRFRSDMHTAPSDPSDFGRCYRLLERFPAWRSRLGEVAARFPEWRDLVAAWDELESLYREEMASGTAPKLYERMRELRR